MRAVLVGGRWDGERIELPDPVPPDLFRPPYSESQIEDLRRAGRLPDRLHPITYRRTDRTHPDGEVIYVLKGAGL